MWIEKPMKILGVASDMEIWDAYSRATGNITWDQDNVDECVERCVSKTY